MRHGEPMDPVILVLIGDAPALEAVLDVSGQTVHGNVAPLGTISRIRP